MLVVDALGRVAFANTAALRVAPFEAGTPLVQLQPVIGAAAVRWLVQAVANEPRQPPPAGRLADGREFAFAWQRLDTRHGALRFIVPDAADPGGPAGPDAAGLASPAVQEMLRLFWAAPFPASVQDASFRLVDVNQAFVDFTGYGRDRLIGCDPIELQREEDRPASLRVREQLVTGAGRVETTAFSEGRLVDGGGRERWYRVARRVLRDEGGAPFYFAVLQDTTPEHVARERADHSVRELDDWFDISPVGMVLFDDSGLLVRTNPAFDEVAGRVPVTLADTSSGLAQLLAWGEGGALARLAPGARPIETHGWVAQPGGEPRRLRAIVRCYQTAGGQRRYMGIVEDRSVEDERDLAQMQIGALIDTAGVGIATFQASSGWVRQRTPARAEPDGGAAALAGEGKVPAQAKAASAALQNITREIVVAESRAEYERLQQAIKQTRRAEVRYAIQHPELGRRWLLTRVEPATLASGERTASVVTLDVTDRQLSQRRNDQLLHEMTTILESTSAGIAYLRGDVLVRCNRGFEEMLGLTAGGVAGGRLVELFARHPDAEALAASIQAALAAGATHESEFDLPEPGGRGIAGDGTRRWYSLAVRRAEGSPAPDEAIAVLTDVTRLKSQQLELETLARESELMFSLSDVGIAFVRGGRIERANAALAALAGRADDELAALPVADLFADRDDAERRLAHMARDLALHGRWRGESRLGRGDGRAVWVQIAARPVDPHDAGGGIIVSWVDVDARHRAEHAVATQAERTRFILDSVLIGIVTVGAGGIEWMNRSARRMFGGSLSEFAGQPMAAVATPEAEHPFRQTRYIDELVEGEAETFECRVRARDGREFWIVGNAVATAREGAGRQLTFALLDIERRRQAEAAVSEAQASLRRVIEAAPLAIALLDAPTLTVVQVNEVAARTVRQDRTGLIGKTLEQIFRPADAAIRRADMQEALRLGAMTTREYAFRAGDGQQVWEARYLPLTAETGAGPGAAADQLLLVATDVSAQRATQEARLEAAIAQRDMLVREVHHRIKNNLQGVAGLLQQIAGRKPEVAPFIDEVVGQVQAIAQVYGLQVAGNGPLALASVLEAICASVQRTFGRDIRCRLDVPDASTWLLPEVEAIPIALVVNELLTNAVKHGEPGTMTPVACRLEGEGPSEGGRDAGVRVAIAGRARLAEGFSLGGIPNGVSGLGLVRALLPRKSAALAIAQVGDEVVATVFLRPPVVTRPSGAADAAA